MVRKNIKRILHLKKPLFMDLNIDKVAKSVPNGLKESLLFVIEDKKKTCRKALCW